MPIVGTCGKPVENAEDVEFMLQEDDEDVFEVRAGSCKFRLENFRS